MTQLKEATIEKLKTLIAGSSMSRRECTTAPLPSKTMWFQLTTAKEFSIEDTGDIAVDSDENLKIEGENIRSYGIKTEEIKNKTSQLSTVACSDIKAKRMEKTNAEVIAVYCEKEKRMKRNRCQVCGTKQSSANKSKSKKYICGQCAKKQKKIIQTNNPKKGKIGRCRKCVIKRQKIATLSPLTLFYNLFATLALSPKKSSWNGRNLL